MALHREIGLMSADARDAAYRARAALDAVGFKYFISETMRDECVQQAYYAQGRQPLVIVNDMRKDAGLWPISEAENKKKITWTTQSKHMTGDAIDIIPMDGNRPLWVYNKDAWAPLVAAFKAQGFEWGGDWKELDYPHFQFIRP